MAFGSIGGTISWPKDTQIYSKVECEITNKTKISSFMFLYMFDWARPGQARPGSRAASEKQLQKGREQARKKKTVKWIALKWRLEEKTNQNLI